MKVLQVTNSLLSGGAEKLLVDSLIKYEEKGIQVDLLLLNGINTPFMELLNSKSKTKIFYSSKSKFIYNPFLVFRLIKYLKKYEVIHVHLFPASYWVALANIFLLKKRKLVFTEHSSSNKRRNIIFFKYIDRFIYKQFNEIITISNAVDINLKKHLGGNFKNIHKIYNGIDLNTISSAIPYTKIEFGFKNTDKIIIQVSSFRYPKDQATVIKALNRLPTNYYLVLVGDGDLRRTCEKLVIDLNLEKRVLFLGVRNDVHNLLKTSDVIVLSSIYEGLSLSSVEGMASGKPFIASNAPGLREVVNGAGLLFKNKNDKDLAKIILKLINDQNYYDQITKDCQLRAKNYDINIMVDNYIKLYKSLKTKF